MEDHKKEIIKIIESMSGRYPPYEVFTDWVLMSAMSIQNSCAPIHDRYWQQREKLYTDTAQKYSRDEIKKIVEMEGRLTLAFEDETRDYLGEIYMESGCGNKYTGQFFTPFHLSLLTASMVVPGDISEDKPFIVNEPSSGGGGMIIAYARVLKDRGINYQRCMDVVAQDLDWKGVYMTYVQLSLLGVKAVVAQGDTLSEPYIQGYPRERVLITPNKAGLFV
jgi:type I restriction-modification system DNA methylase subunit